MCKNNFRSRSRRLNSVLGLTIDTVGRPHPKSKVYAYRVKSGRNSGETKRRIQTPEERGITKEAFTKEAWPPPQIKMNFSLEMACFDEL